MSDKAFKWDAKEYEQNSTAQQLWARELFAKIGLRGNERILDIGCGDGKVTSELAAMVPEGSVVGIDNSGAMIKLADERYPQAKYPNLHFSRNGAEDLPFQEEFDVVFSNAALHWVKDQQAVLAGISRALKKGGRILLQMGGKGNGGDLFDIVKVMGEEEEWKPYFNNFDIPYTFPGPDEYRKWMHEAGLCPDRVELLEKDMVHKGREGLAGWLRPVSMPYTTRIPGQLHSPFIDELIGRYLQSHPLDGEGMTHVRMVRLEVEAVKC